MNLAIFIRRAIWLPVWLLFSCSPGTQPVTNADRIVCLGGGITEIVYALDAGTHVVGVDTSSLYPTAAQELATLGYHRQVSVEGVLSLRPTLVIASDESGPPEALDQIRAAGVDVRQIESPADVDSTIERIESIATLLNRPERGAGLIASLQNDLETTREHLQTVPEAERVRAAFIYVRGAKVLLAAGKYSPAARMLELAGAENALDDFYGFKPLQAESLVAAQPDAIVMLTRGVESIGGPEQILELPGVALTPAGKNRRFIIVDDALFSGFTHRLGQAIADLGGRLYPAMQSRLSGVQGQRDLTATD
ncbi:MAG: hemin ABC transporter substrate-binding protein [Leptospiraceae bacterium]|nr:hemin ABC transporter substrate-binding protein [Leptospiraceae bacterium]